jgi:hypothetical protein
MALGTTLLFCRYAAEYWVAHAQFERVSSYLRTLMESLFNPDKPYFASWLGLYDTDTRTPTGSTSHMFTSTSRPYAEIDGTHLPFITPHCVDFKISSKT